MAVVIDILNNDPRKKDASARHPEKAHRPDQEVMRKPDWIRVKAPGSPQYAATRAIVKEHKLVTVCEEAGCPNTLAARRSRSGRSWTCGFGVLLQRESDCSFVV